MDMTEDGQGARWLSYGELAQLRGTDTESAIRLVRRRKWPKRQANDGTVRVAIPADILRDMKPRPPAAAKHSVPADARADLPPDVLPVSARGRGDTDRTGELVEALRAQVADLVRRLDASEAERSRLVLVIEGFAARRPEPASMEDFPPNLAARAEAAERQAAELRAVIERDLTELKRLLAVVVRAPAPRRRPGLLRRLLG